DRRTGGMGGQPLTGLDIGRFDASVDHTRSTQRQEAKCPRRVGPPRAGEFTLRAEVEKTDAPDPCAPEQAGVAIRVQLGDQGRAAAATRFAASSRGCRFAPRRGSDVSTTQMVLLAGSAQQSVPVEPVWPKVRSEHPGLPASLPTASPSPRGV